MEPFLIFYATWVIFYSKLNLINSIICFYHWHLFRAEIKNDEAEVTGGVIFSKRINPSSIQVPCITANIVSLILGHCHALHFPILASWMVWEKWKRQIKVFRFPVRAGGQASHLLQWRYMDWCYLRSLKPIDSGFLRIYKIGRCPSSNVWCAGKPRLKISRL